MQLSPACVLLAVLVATAPGAAATNPLAKVISMIDDLAAKVTKDGETEAKAYKEYFEWCDDTSKNAAFEIKSGTAKKGKLEAKITELASSIESAGSKIEELGASIAKSESELKKATAIRKTESSDFAAGEKELMEAVDTLDRAVGIISRQMQKGGAALTQVDTSTMSSLLSSLSVVMDAAAFASSDREKLLAFVQSQQGGEDEDGELGAPKAAVYESKSGGIIDVLEDMKEKAEGQLSDLRKAESTSKHNFSMLKQSLEDQITYDTKEMDEEKANMAADEESKATAEGDLEVTVKDLEADKEALATAQSTCMQTSADHEATTKARTEELAVIAQAKKILEDTSSGAVEETYSLLQVVSMSQSKTPKVVSMVKQLARKHHSAALAQLASRIAAVARYGGDDVFAKVKGLIVDMVGKLEKEAAEEASEKAFCDEELAKTEAKKSDLEDTVSKLTSKIDQASANSATLKQEVKDLQAALAALAKEQAKLDAIRTDEHEAYAKAKEDLTLGLSGVRKALTLLRDYYGTGAAAMIQDEAKFGAFMQQPAMPEKHEASGGAGQSIISILEVCESDFANGLAKEETEEADSQAEYEQVTQENKVTKTGKDQDVKYKTQEHTGLDKAIGELSGDRETSNTELNAVLEYYAKLKDRCIAKPETYEERKQRREAEINGLKEALSILESEAAFVQRKSRHLRRTALSNQ